MPTSKTAAERVQEQIAARANEYVQDSINQLRGVIAQWAALHLGVEEAWLNNDGDDSSQWNYNPHPLVAKVLDGLASQQDVSSRKFRMMPSALWKIAEKTVSDVLMRNTALQLKQHPQQTASSGDVPNDEAVIRAFRPGLLEDEAVAEENKDGSEHSGPDSEEGLRSLGLVGSGEPPHRREPGS